MLPTNLDEKQKNLFEQLKNSWLWQKEYHAKK
jgi:hypothetical protein